MFNFFFSLSGTYSEGGRESLLRQRGVDNGAPSGILSGLNPESRLSKAITVSLNVASFPVSKADFFLLDCKGSSCLFQGEAQSSG